MIKIGKIKTHSSKELNTSFVSIGFECVDRDLINPKKCYDAIMECGIKYARCQTGWAKCEKEKGIYDFTWLDDMVDNLLQRDVTPWFNVGYGNPIYMKDAPNPTAVGCVPTLYDEETLNAWINYVKELAKRYKGKVKDYEIWNEPNLAHFWHPGAGNGKEYANLVKVTGRAIKEADPDARIGGCIDSGTGFNFFPFAIDFCSNITKNDFDFFSVHSYTKTPEALNSVNRYSYLRKIFNNNGLSDIRFRQGEAGYPAYIPEEMKGCTFTPPEGNTSDRQMCTWMMRRYFIDKSLDMELSSWYQIADASEKPYQMLKEIWTSPPHYGILEGKTYKKRPAYYVMQRIASFFEDVESADYYSSLRTNIHELEIKSKLSLTFKKNGYPIYAFYITDYVAEENDYREFKLMLEASKFDVEKQIENPVIVDLMTGEVFEPEEIRPDDMMLRIPDIKITDYPIVVCDKSIIDITEIGH